MPASTVIGVAPYSATPVDLGTNATHHHYFTPTLTSSDACTLTIQYIRDGGIMNTEVYNVQAGDTVPMSAIHWTGIIRFTRSSANGRVNLI